MRIIYLLILLLPLFLSGCSNQQAKELFETAQFEEQQFNRDHAKKLYQEILVKYPDSEYAPKAKERIEQMAKR